MTRSRSPPRPVQRPGSVPSRSADRSTSIPRDSHPSATPVWPGLDSPCRALPRIPLPGRIRTTSRPPIRDGARSGPDERRQHVAVRHGRPAGVASHEPGASSCFSHRSTRPGALFAAPVSAARPPSSPRPNLPGGPAAPPRRRSSSSSAPRTARPASTSPARGASPARRAPTGLGSPRSTAPTRPGRASRRRPRARTS